MRSDPCVHTSCAPLGPRQKCKASGKLDSNLDWDHPPMPYAVKIINNYGYVKGVSLFAQFVRKIVHFTQEKRARIN